MERALREGRERAHRLDLVAEELDPERLAAGRREDVDDAAAHRELAAVVDPLHALVARQARATPPALRRPARDRPAPRSARDAPRPAAALRRAPSPRRRRARRCASTWSARARSPTRCGGGASPDSQRDAAARQQADRLVAEEPGRALGGVARVRVLRQEHDQAALDALVERREQQRQRGLRDAGARRQRVRELGEALVLDELPNECVQYRTVHDEGRNRRVPRTSMVTSRLEAYIPGRARGRSLRAAERTAVQAALVRAHRFGGRRLAHPRRPHLGRRPRPRRRRDGRRPRSRLLHVRRSRRHARRRRLGGPAAAARR